MKALFRENATAGASRWGAEGDVLALDSRAARWAYRIIFAACAVGLALAGVLRIHGYATGPAVVRVDGRRAVTATFPGTIERVLVAPGQRVEEGAPLVTFYSADERAQYDRVSSELDLQLVRLLRDPSDVGAKQSLTALKAQKDLAASILKQRVLRAPVAGAVTDIRVRPGQRLAAGEPVLALAPKDAPISLVCAIPGEYRPMIATGLPVRFSLDGYRYEYHDMVVEDVGTEVVGAAEVRRYLGPETADALHLAEGSYVLVRGRIPSSFLSEGKTYGYFDGLTGTADIRVRKESLAVILIPALKAVIE
ncbi:MAG: HlyD family efflux transporter periplasmic adaptor subunit [Labilithrix sp.]|nr:HlyD family efflux transporter periplasmic adaptor subunit [Labilithrix sp.]